MKRSLLFSLCALLCVLPVPAVDAQSPREANAAHCGCDGCDKKACDCIKGIPCPGCDCKGDASKCICRSFNRGGVRKPRFEGLTPAPTRPRFEGLTPPVPGKQLPVTVRHRICISGPICCTTESACCSGGKSGLGSRNN